MQERVHAGSPHARLKLLGYYAQRICTSRILRRLGQRALVAGLRALHGPAGTVTTRPVTTGPVDAAPLDPAALARLRGVGCVDMGRLLSAAQCDAALAWLRDKEMVVGRRGAMPPRRFRIDDVPPHTRIGDYPLETLVNCPHLLEVANHPLVLAMAAAWLGYTPVISLMGLRWTFPSEDAPDDGLLAYHRDAEPGCIKLLVYLTDVDLDAGPHSYMPGSHLERMPLRLRHYSEHEARLAHGAPLDVTGAAGSAVFIDTKGVHRGTPPRRRARLLLGVQYSLLPCLLYDYTPVAYRGAGRFSHCVNRLMVAPA